MNKDSVVIDAEENYKVAKKDLPSILKECPEFKEDGLSPDDCYATQRKNINFSCEVCRDDYYSLYAYFVKERNGAAQYHVQRTKLIKLYRDINYIYGCLQGGGTYFGHQDRRILGYAEYSVWLLKEDSDYYAKAGTITKQKALYINEIKQLITDELDTSETYFTTNEKFKVKKELFQTVSQLDGLITNSFYLKMAQRYQYSNY